MYINTYYSHYYYYLEQFAKYIITIHTATGLAAHRCVPTGKAGAAVQKLYKS